MSTLKIMNLINDSTMNTTRSSTTAFMRDYFVYPQNRTTETICAMGELHRIYFGNQNTDNLTEKEKEVIKIYTRWKSNE